ncbi:MAG: Crp/Fnr family transcriptional regulator [Acidobacteriia bacterium]|nr:Crp/Fnr family transcriptional regulator [Terriglobia bacterium]
MNRLLPAVEEAACKGILARLSSRMRFLLLSAGHANDVPAGKLVYAAEDQPPFVGLILDGFLRVFVAAPSGRESTIRYVRPGDLLGLVAALSGPSATWVQTLSDCRIWILDPAALKRIGQTELPIAWVIAEECARRVADLVNEISGSAFATVRQRIAHHLLSMARSQAAPPFLVADITQSDLANAAGSVREVTVRELRALKAEGLVRPQRKGIAILDPDQLHRIASEAFIHAG